jgi:drug/metabolite transporter (DMT)-like permease
MGRGAAVLDGFFLAVWGIVSKKLALFDPGAFEYSMVLVFAGLGYFLSALLPLEKKAFKQVNIVDRKIYLFLSAFVLISVLQFYLGVKVYEYKEADVAVSSFLRNSSLVFAALLAHFARFSGGMFIESRLSRKSIFGSVLFMLGVWIFFGSPMSSQDGTRYLSFWVVGSLLIGCNRAMTELLTQKFAKTISRVKMNVVAGIGLGIIGGLGCGIYSRGANFSSYWIYWAIAVGFIVPIMQTFRFIALKVMNEILGKKGYAIWTYLFASMLLGAFFFSEELSLSKWLGLAIGGVAVVFLDENTLREIKLLCSRKKVIKA